MFHELAHSSTSLHQIGAQSVYTMYTLQFTHTGKDTKARALTWHGKDYLAYLAEMQDGLGEAGMHGVQGMEDTSQTSSRLCVPYAALACCQAQRQSFAFWIGLRKEDCSGCC